MKFADLFAGIGGFHQAIKESADIDCVLACDTDANAQKTYLHNHKTKKFVADVRDVKKIEEVDLVCAGFPCQAFSVAGYRKGLDDDRGLLALGSSTSYFKK